MELMARNRAVAVALPVREQSEILESRRKKRRERINTVHAEVRAMLQSDISATLTVAGPKRPLPKSK
jgi:hypothetical protein